MKVLFCGGGTAGHIMPAIAMAQIIEKNFKNAEIAFVGRSGGSENRSIINDGYNLYTINVTGIKRSFSINNIKSIFLMIKSSRKCKRILKNYNPDVVIGTGGYVCYPVIRKAQLMNIPTIIHESNVYPGIVTRMIGNKCSKLLLNLDGAKKYLKSTKNIIVTGNPVRTGFKKINREDARKSLNIGKKDIFIVSFGGSLGSKVINENVLDIMLSYSLKKPNIRHIHSTGKNNYQEFEKYQSALSASNGKCKVVPYIDDMPRYLNAADIVIARSGAITLSELSASGVAAILIPSPNVSENHQYLNAKYMSDRGGAILIEEKNLTKDSLISAIDSLASNFSKREKLRYEISKFTSNDVEKRIVSAIKSVL